MKRYLGLLVLIVVLALAALVTKRQAQTWLMERGLEQELVAGHWEQAQELALAWEKHAPQQIVAHWLAFRTAQRLRDDHAGWPGRDRVCARGFAQLAPLEVWGRKLVARHPQSPVAWQLYTDALTLERKPNEVLSAAEQCVRLAPCDPYSYLARAWAYDIRGDTGRAVANVQTSIRTDPQCAWAYADLGVLRSERKERASSLAAFQKCVAVNPRSTTGYLFLGLAYLRDLQYDDALKALDRAVALGAASSRLYDARAFTYQALGKADEARQDLDRAVACLPDSAQPYLARAQFYHKTKDERRALADINRVIRLGLKEPWGYALRADIYRALGQNKRADHDLHRYEKLSEEPNRE